MKARRDVYQAIADPTRRAIVDMLANQPHNMNAIAHQFEMTRQAISLHVKILADCGLVKMKREGREQICEAKLDALSEVDEWVGKYRKHYEDKLDKLNRYLQTLKKEKNERHNR
ncbi:ArsR/SmtB family transcription factor [Mucilaginibacter ximonensis]|uniref:ArsR/SmtB family transcription factor n=1 Tax=Mucilaginibacter ximonensis TaxID=538021 RepID=A0ABW5YB18_9SPHI